MPNFKVDTGVSRRFKGYTHQASFTDDDELIDNKNHIYKVDKDLLSKLIEGNLMNAFFDILAEKCSSWLKGKHIKFTKNFVIYNNRTNTINCFIISIWIIYFNNFNTFIWNIISS